KPAGGASSRRVRRGLSPGPDSVGRQCPRSRGQSRGGLWTRQFCLQGWGTDCLALAMSQTVTSDRFPYLPLYLEVRQRNERVEALVDTGFDGDVVVPSDFIADTERPDSYLSCRLADTSEVLAPVYRSH